MKYLLSILLPLAFFHTAWAATISHNASLSIPEVQGPGQIVLNVATTSWVTDGAQVTINTNGESGPVLAALIEAEIDDQLNNTVSVIAGDSEVTAFDGPSELGFYIVSSTVPGFSAPAPPVVMAQRAGDEVQVTWDSAGMPDDQRVIISLQGLVTFKVRASKGSVTLPVSTLADNVIANSQAFVWSCSEVNGLRGNVLKAPVAIQ